MKQGKAIAMLLLALALMASAGCSSQKPIDLEEPVEQVPTAAELQASLQDGASTREVTLYYDRSKQHIYRPVSNTRTDATGDFAFLMNNAIKQLLLTPDLVYRRAFTIKARQAEVYEDGSCELTLSCRPESEGTTAYALTVWFTGGTSEHPCRMRLTMNGTQTYSSLTTSYYEGNQEYFQEVVTSSFIWSDAVLAREDGV